MTNKLIVGLTGVFGSGKTTVANLLGELGASVVDADKLAHEAFWKGSEVYKKASALFPEAVTSGGDLDRKKIAAIVFADARKREALEKIIHPYVFTRIEEEILGAEAAVVVVDIPLLFETGFEKLCDVTVTVSAPQAALEQRLKEKGFSAEEAKARFQAQMSLGDKEKRSDFVIDNSNGLKETKERAEKLWHQLLAKAKTA